MSTTDGPRLLWAWATVLTKAHDRKSGGALKRKRCIWPGRQEIYVQTAVADVTTHAPVRNQQLLLCPQRLAGLTPANWTDPKQLQQQKHVEEQEEDEREATSMHQHLWWKQQLPASVCTF